MNRIWKTGVLNYEGEKYSRPFLLQAPLTRVKEAPPHHQNHLIAQGSESPGGEKCYSVQCVSWTMCTEHPENQKNQLCTGHGTL